jgi:hypothetical protein
MKDFVPHDLSSALLNLGFDADDYFGFWNLFDYSNEWKLDARIQYDCIHYVGAPLYQQAFRWFRTEYSIDSHIRPNISINVPKTYQFIIDDDIDDEWHMSYEEAELACLKKLIEIVKKK